MLQKKIQFYVSTYFCPAPYKQQQLEIAKASKEINDNNVEVNNNNHDNIQVIREELDENEPDIQANMYMIELKW